MTHCSVKRSIILSTHFLRQQILGCLQLYATANSVNTPERVGHRCQQMDALKDRIIISQSLTQKSQSRITFFSISNKYYGVRLKCPLATGQKRGTKFDSAVITLYTIQVAHGWFVRLPDNFGQLSRSLHTRRSRYEERASCNGHYVKSATKLPTIPWGTIRTKEQEGWHLLYFI